MSEIALVAGLFLPLRPRVHAFVDRRFRRRYDALEAFGARLREQVEVDGLRADREDIVTETMHPTYVCTWRRSGR